VLVIPEGFAQVSVRIDLVGFPRPAWITFGVDAGTATTNDALTKVVTAVNDATTIRAVLISGTVGLRRVVMRHNVGGEIFTIETPLTSDGSLTGGTAHPPNVAVLVHKITAHGGRRGKGRLYFPWAVAEPATTEAGTIGTSQLASFQSAMNAFRTKLSTESVPMQVLHNAKKIGGAGTIGDPAIYESVPAPYPVTALAADALVGTQRRRLGR